MQRQFAVDIDCHSRAALAAHAGTRKSAGLLQMAANFSLEPWEDLSRLRSCA